MKISLSRKTAEKRRYIELELYIMLLLPLAFLTLFKLVPLFWQLVAFQDYNIFKGIRGSEWVGLKHFRRLIQDPGFLRVARNTFLISVYRLVILFPMPIIVALMFNEMRCITAKKLLQTSVYLPHFISWVVASAMITSLLQFNGGLINEMLVSLGINKINFLSEKSLFRTILVVTAGWKDIGWNSIIYLAAITGIDPALYEAAEIDGAGRFRCIWHITLSGIQSTIVVLLLIRIGNMMASNMEQVIVLYNPLVYETGDVIDTYVYRTGITQMDYSFPTAVGLFNSVISCLLLVGANWTSRKLLNKGLW